MSASSVDETGTASRVAVSATPFLSIFLIFAFLVPQGLYAADLEDVNQDAIRIQQQQQQRLEELDKRARERKTPPPEIPVIAPPTVETEPDEQLCVVIKSFSIEGNSILADRQIAEVTTNYLNQCLSRSDINRLLQEITRIYFHKGYITTRAYLKPQDISNGSLIITIIEGRIESLKPVKDKNLTEKIIYYSFPTTTGEILNLRELEQGLDQLNRLQSNAVRMKLEPGTDPGDSHILLKNDMTRNWHISAGIDNGGQKATGENQGHLSFGFDNLTGRADYLNLNIAHDLNSDSNKLSRSLATLYEIPWKWWLFKISANASEYKKNLYSTLQTFETSGSSQNYQIITNRVIHRNQIGKSTVGLTLNFKDERNYLEDVLLNSSSQRLTVGRMKLYHRQQLDKTSLGLNLTVHQGFPALGAESDSNLPPDAPRAKFTKLTGRVSVVFDTLITRLPLRYAMTATGQYCQTNLYGSEQISIGGLFTVRGYFDEGFSGKAGGYIRNDLSTTLKPPELLRAAIFEVLEPFVAFDWGAVNSLSSIDSGYNSLAGWGAGLRGHGKYGRLDLLYAQPINPPTQFIERDGKLSFSVSIYL